MAAIKEREAELEKLRAETAQREAELRKKLEEEVAARAKAMGWTYRFPLFGVFGLCADFKFRMWRKQGP